MFDPHLRPELEPVASPAGARSKVWPAHEGVGVFWNNDGPCERADAVEPLPNER